MNSQYPLILNQISYIMKSINHQNNEIKKIQQIRSSQPNSHLYMSDIFGVRTLRGILKKKLPPSDQERVQIHLTRRYSKIIKKSRLFNRR